MKILPEILRALEQDEWIVLCAIVAARGSVPAPTSSRMALVNGGREWVGTVGGGSLEAEVQRRAREVLRTGAAEIASLALDESPGNLGVLCGGSVEVLLQPISRSERPVLAAMEKALGEGEDGVLASFIAKEPGPGFLRFFHGVSGVREEFRPVFPGIGAEIDAAVEDALKSREPRQISTESHVIVLDPVSGKPPLFIFGGGHVSRFVVPPAAMVGFRVTVVDDRPEFANPDRFPEAERTLARGIRESFASLPIGPSAFILIVTRGHEHDQEALELALRTPARYIGMIGSKRKVSTVFSRLLEKGVAMANLRRVHAPVGIDMCSVTVEEIGISIVAELIAVRRGSNAPLPYKSSIMDSFFAGRT